MLNEVEKNYIKAHYKWLKEQSLTDRELIEDTEHNKRLISILQERNFLNSDRLKSNSIYTESVKDQFKSWCAEADVKADDLLELI